MIWIKNNSLIEQNKIPPLITASHRDIVGSFISTSHSGKKLQRLHQIGLTPHYRHSLYILLPEPKLTAVPTIRHYLYILQLIVARLKCKVQHLV